MTSVYSASNQFETPKRALALDALRGFAILTMFLSGLIPFGVLPSWMYHAQVPPPNHQFNPFLPGITWVDLVFPFFLFSMGAAIPLAQSRRLEAGTPRWKLSLGALGRGLLLAGFAIYDQNMRPYVINPNPTTITWILALLGFILLFPVLGRFPIKLSKQNKWLIKIIGLIAVIIYFYFLPYPEGKGFSLYRSDIIILVLANVAFTGTLIWLLTSSNVLLRVGFLGFVLAARLLHAEVHWGVWLWKSSPIPWLGNLYFQQYLFIIIPGTIAGDLILKWMNSPERSSFDSTNWQVNKLWSIVIVMISFIVIALIGLKARYVLETVIASIGLCLIGWALINQSKSATENLVKSIFLWGVYWLLLGLAFEPYEGGIKKDHPTMSYYFVTSGLACFLLIAFTIIIDSMKKKKWLQLLIDNGQNPMIAYAGITNLIPPILGLIGLWAQPEFLKPYPWLGALRGLLITLLLAYCVKWFTKKKIFLRT
ncbi:MAG: DUF5009 domain-containing protein [Ignavibacteria bacterium]|nr:DUF5009 domain-containing protein [Ignavibacteria bacterium]